MAMSTSLPTRSSQASFSSAGCADGLPVTTAICPFSDFPDFAIIKLKYMPNERCIELKSLKLYINSFREIKVFHEHVINIILEDFVKACDPLKVEIEGDFHVRGNIKTIVRASYRRGEEEKRSGGED